MAPAGEVIHAYRHLYRGLLHAVQFAKPARYVARDQLRDAFREKDAEFDSRGIARTLRFLEAATKSRGLEHRVLKNLISVAWHRRMGLPWRQQRVVRVKTEFKADVEATAFKNYDLTVAMLNKSTGLCLR